MRRRGLTIAGWQKNSFIDFPGRIATVLFLGGCNLRCPYCHNPTIVQGTGAPCADLSEVIVFLRKRRPSIDGVVFSGGEPTMHSGLPDAVDQIRMLGIKVKLDTNGLLPEVIDAIRPDYLALDIKTRPEDYPRLLGASIADAGQCLRRSIDTARCMAGNAEVRITVAPGIVTGETIAAIGELIAGVSTVFLQPVQRGVGMLDPAFAEKETVAPEVIRQYRDVLAPKVGTCTIRGEG